MKTQAAIVVAVHLAGSQRKLAAASGVSQQQISKLLRGERPLSAEIAVAIEGATRGVVQREQLRPDLWGKGRPKPARRARRH
jgi:DNA-binding transcriptional regulator YdaS (Cro superfamily)